MCGIAGIAGPGALRHAERLRAMRDALGHRGPDARGEHLSANCVLGHTRLSIIDLATGDQPFPYAGGATTTVFNGELYGYKELRGQLDQDFRSASDTELIPALYALHGADCCQRLPGMFAFGLWDEPGQRLLLARDRFGEKPLYYATARDGCLVFASELPALLASGLVRPVLNLEAVSAYLTLRYVPEGLTIYRDVHTLAPGHRLVFADGRASVSAYWTAPKPLDPAPSFEEAREEFRFLMARAVRRCLVADVDVAVLLSGGLDSTTIAALAAQEARLQAFSFGFEGQRSELPFARAAAEQYDLPLTELSEDQLDLPAMLLTMNQVYGEPFADPSAIPTFALCRRVSEHVKVALGGDGGDELLAGYTYWYRHLVDLEPGRVSPGWSAVAQRHWEDASYYAPEQIAELGLPPAPRPRLAAPTGSLDDALRLDIDTFLTADILRKVDRAAMANHLELRSPFLDRDLASFLMALPWRYKADGTSDKILLRSAFGGLWPESIRGRGKQGFGANVFHWQHRPEMAEMRQHYLFEPARRIRALFPREPFLRHAADTANYGWLMLVLAIWLEHSPWELP